MGNQENHMKRKEEGSEFTSNHESTGKRIIKERSSKIQRYAIGSDKSIIRKNGSPKI